MKNDGSIRVDRSSVLNIGSTLLVYGLTSLNKIHGLSRNLFIKIGNGKREHNNSKKGNKMVIESP